VNTPAGGDTCPTMLLPQQTAVPSPRNPHVWKLPAVRCVNALREESRPSPGEAILMSSWLAPLS